MTSTAPLRLPAPVSERLPFAPLLVMLATSFLLVAAELLPNGMLVEMADGLGITSGQAGQTVTVTALVGLIVAPSVGLMFPRIDRRSLLVWMAVAAAASNIAVALAPNFLLVLVARLLLGMAISSFWAMSITVAAAIVGPARLGKAVVFTALGNSLATVAGVPLAVFFTSLVEWRWVFAAMGIATALLAVATRLLLPQVPAEPASSIRILIDTLRRPGVTLGLIAHTFIVLGHFLAYTYVRIALDRIPNIEAGAVVLLLALFGLGGLVGNPIVSRFVDRKYALLSVVVPLGIAITLGAVLTASLIVVGIAVFFWGFGFASWLLVVNTWIGHRVPDRLEAGGSLVVVGFQLAIVAAAGGGGLLVDIDKTVGVQLTYLIAVVLLLVGAVLFGTSHRAVKER